MRKSDVPLHKKVMYTLILIGEILSEKLRKKIYSKFETLAITLKCKREIFFFPIRELHVRVMKFFQEF